MPPSNRLDGVMRFLLRPSTHAFRGLLDFALRALLVSFESKTYDLIIEDINLHGAKVGKKIIQKIRESKLNIGTPLIVWTAYTNESDEEIYRAWGADSALKKNCGIEGLKKSIKQCLLTPRYERKDRFKLKILQTNWQENSSAEFTSATFF